MTSRRGWSAPGIDGFDSEMMMNSSQNVVWVEPTWDDLTRLEPRLADLEAACRADRDPDPVGRWYQVHKSVLVDLVGFSRSAAARPAETGADRVLRSPEAHALAYDRCYDALMAAGPGA